MKKDKIMTLKTLSKGNVWDIQENDVFRLCEAANKDADLKDNLQQYINIIKSAFDVEKIIVDKPEIIKKYEARGYKVGTVKVSDNERVKWAVKKKPIMRVTDLTYENIHHISAAKLLEVIDRNFGGGWDSLSQSIRDIIESGFDISTTTLPSDRLHKPGGLYEKKVADGYEVLEIPKGSWTEAIFAKLRPETESLSKKLKEDEDTERRIKLSQDDSDADDNDEELPDENFNSDSEDDEDDDFDEDKLTEESYRTTFEEDPETLNLEAEDISDDEDY